MVQTKYCHPLHREIGKVDDEVGLGEVDREEEEGVEVEVVGEVESLIGAAKSIYYNAESQLIY